MGGFDATPPMPGPRAGVDDFLLAFRQSRVGLGLWLAFCLALAAAYLVQATPEYVATTQVILEPRPQVTTGSDATAGAYGPQLDSAQADSQIQVVKSERNLRFVFDTLNLKDDPAYAGSPPGLLERVASRLLGSSDAASGDADLSRAQAFQSFADRVGVRRIGSSYVLEVAFRARSPAEAARLANAVTASYIRDQIEFKAASVQRGMEFLQGRIADIKAEQSIATESVRTGVIPDVQFSDSDARIVSAAIAPLGKTYPQSKLILLLAGTFGLLSGAGFVVVRKSLDRTVRSREQIERAMGLDCLAVLPTVRVRIGKRYSRAQLGLTAALDAPDSDFARTLRVLRTLLLSGAAPRHIVVGLVSWSPREGRSAVAANLAFMFAAAKERVALVDADLQNASLTRALAPDAALGIADLLAPRGAQPSIPSIGLTRTLGFYPAGRPGDMAGGNLFVGSAEMQHFLKSLRGEGHVILDLPALSLSSDAQALGRMIDGVILLVEANRTTLDEVTEAMRALRAGRLRVLGLVLNKG